MIRRATSLGCCRLAEGAPPQGCAGNAEAGGSGTGCKMPGEPLIKPAVDDAVVDSQMNLEPAAGALHAGNRLVQAV